MTDFLDGSAPHVADTLYSRHAVPPVFPACTQCSSEHTKVENAMYRCDDCFHAPILCARCMKAEHLHHPFHRIRKLDRESRYWGRCTLQELGLVLYLGHEGSRCCYALDSHAVVVVHEHGISKVNISFCHCVNTSWRRTPEATQLLKVGLWPATWLVPRTVFTLDVMCKFRVLSVQAHTNAHDFIQSLVRLDDDIFPEDVEVSLSPALS